MDYETPQFYRVMQYAARADRDVVDMVSGSPDWDPPTALREGLREYADGEPADFRYGPSEGLRPLRQAIAEERGVAVDRVLVTNGAGEANHLAMAGGLDLFPGDEIVLTDPVYPYYAGRANVLGAETTFAPVDDSGHLKPDTLREAVSDETAVIVVNTPNNPTGSIYDADAMAAFVEIAEANDALLVSDEVYRHFDYSDRFATVLALDSPNVAVTDAFSKSMAITGFRVGYLVLPPREGVEGVEEADRAAALHDDARTRHMLTTVTGSRPAQFAVQRALEATGPDYYEANRERLHERIDTFCDALDAVGATYDRPEGGFYVMARFDGIPGTFDAVYDLVDDAGVAAMPGEAFGESRREYLRFVLCTPSVEEAGDRLVAHLD